MKYLKNKDYGLNISHKTYILKAYSNVRVLEGKAMGVAKSVVLNM